MKKNTVTEGASPADSAAHVPVEPAAPEDTRGVLLFSLPTEGRTHRPEDYAPVR
ncbi:hypothetical protein [Streptomyces sp. TBY4]|uniref:hypothetical protein n=1 Tax=Streptomyces sp. TBY4 TaxID=2962030 RepID=UPI0020B778C9|nr:hypothetical protein [Streptomyces sp. TBY4]MCP3758143.1 hypothetical protein [Streptomyces sp. TBY4]